MERKIRVPDRSFSCSRQDGSGDDGVINAAVAGDDASVVLVGYDKGLKSSVLAVKLDATGSVLWQWQVGCFLCARYGLEVYKSACSARRSTRKTGSGSLQRRPLGIFVLPTTSKTFKMMKTSTVRSL